MEINKENSVLDLSKCTEEERKSLPQILEKARQEIYFLAKPTLLSGKLDLYYPYLVFSRPSSNVWVFSHNKPDRTELTYPEFIKLFEGGESDGWIKIKNEKDLPKEDILYWVVKNGEVVDMENWELTLNFHNKRGVTHYQPIQKPEPPKF